MNHPVFPIPAFIVRITIERIVRHQTVGQEAGLGICLSGNRNRDERREDPDKQRDERLTRGEPIYSPLSKPVEMGMVIDSGELLVCGCFVFIFYTAFDWLNLNICLLRWLCQGVKVLFVFSIGLPP